MRRRLPALDGLRAIAILIVMISHAGLGHIVPGGLGVTIFFFLSGYLITTLMVVEWEKDGRLDFAGFYLRRAVRIIPPMMIAIGFAVVLSLAGYLQAINYAGLTWDFLFLSNYAGLLDAGSNIPIPLWSLDVEEHFYLLFPVVFAMLRRRIDPSGVAVACLLLCAAVLAIRVATVVELGPIADIYYWSHTRIDSIIFGCALACWNNPATDDKTYIGGHILYAIFGGALILATLSIREPIFRETLRYSVQGVGLFLVFNYALRNQGLAAKVLARPALKIVADLSYFLYLIHVPIFISASHFIAQPIVQYAVAFTLSFLLAALVRRTVELPLLRWRKLIELKLGVKVSTI